MSIKTKSFKRNVYVTLFLLFVSLLYLAIVGLPFELGEPWHRYAFASALVLITLASLTLASSVSNKPRGKSRGNISRAWANPTSAVVSIALVVAGGLAIHQTFAASAWNRLPGCAKDIAASSTTVWAIGCSPVPGGYTIHYWKNGAGWVRVRGGATNITVDKNGVPWVVNSSNYIYRYNLRSKAWERMPGRAIDISSWHETWVVGTDKKPYIWQSGQQRWAKVDKGFSAERIEAFADARSGYAFALTSKGEIKAFTYTNEKAQTASGCARDIGMAGTNSAIIGCSLLGSGGYGGLL